MSDISDNRKHKKRSNSFNTKNNNKLIIKNSEEKELLNKSIILPKKEMITFKKIQNIGLTTYNYIFLGREILSNKIVQDFESFTTTLKEIKNKFNPKILKNKFDAEIIKKEGKFSFNNSNITELIPLNKKDKNNYEISINCRYLKTWDIKKESINFYSTKCFFKGKHCFEIQILSNEWPVVGIGLINILTIDSYNKLFKNSVIFDIDTILTYDYKNLNVFILKEPILLQKNNNAYNHFISYGDIFGICYDL